MKEILRFDLEEVTKNRGNRELSEKTQQCFQDVKKCGDMLKATKALLDLPKEEQYKAIKEELRYKDVKAAQKASWQCASCGKPASCCCAKCKHVYYCNSECMTAHWKEHKPKCKRKVTLWF